MGMRSFEAFSDHDFELLVADLFRTHQRRRYEAFARGAVGGGTVDQVTPHIVHNRGAVRSDLDAAVGVQGPGSSFPARPDRRNRSPWLWRTMPLYLCRPGRAWASGSRMVRISRTDGHALGSA